MHKLKKAGPSPQYEMQWANPYRILLRNIFIKITQSGIKKKGKRTREKKKQKIKKSEIEDY